MSDSNDNLYNDDLPKQYYVIRDITCSNCNTTFKMPAPRYQRLRLKESHQNLRAEYENTEPMYYEVIFCPNCGYTRLKNNFEQVNDLKKKLYKDEIGIKFVKRENEVTLDADKALERYKFGLLTAKSMSLPASEVAVLFYKLSWLNQIQGDEIEYIKSVAKSYTWFEKALAEEDFPAQNIDADTAEYLMSVFSKDFGDYTVSLKHLGAVLTSTSASDRLKNRARDLKIDVTKLKEKYPDGKNILEEIGLKQSLHDIKDRRVNNYRSDGQSEDTK